ncbi:hypothetical protein [Gaoshiqia sp. Z1-71]|uniref:hypothetical protein n=1 Tax=Gaoshiqia hydrogeniformans TaxID=3290090 RepID=UPI003BF7A795
MRKMNKSLEEAARLIDANRLDEAKQLIAGLPELQEDAADCQFLLGKIACRKQEWGMAVNHFNRTLAIDPEYPSAQAQIDMVNDILGYYTPDMFNP